MKKVSVIMPTYNRSYVISRAICSVINQTCTDWELIIVDDGSKDDTKDRVVSFKDSRIKYIYYEKNRGGNYARNLGMKNSSGEYIAFLDSDNEWNCDYLEKQLKQFENNFEEVHFVFARTLIINNTYNCIFPIIDKKDIQTEEEMMKKLMYTNILDTNVCIMKRIIYEQLGGFNEELRRSQDWEYFLRVFRSKAYKFKFNDEVLCVNHVQDNSITNNTSLYWDARLYIFEKLQIEFCRDVGISIDVIDYMLTNYWEETMSVKQIEKFFSILNAEEKRKLFKKYYDYKKASRGYNLAKKNEEIIQLQKKWISALENGKNTVNYFGKYNIKSVCIYGFGVLGSLLFHELKNSDIEISYVIDKNVKSDEVDIYKLEEIDNFECDIIVVTAIAAFDEILSKLREKTTDKIISIKEIIENL